MTPKQFAGLAAAAALSLLAAILVYGSRTDWASDAAGTGLLFPGLKADAEKVSRISVTQGDKTVAIEKAGDHWLIKSRDGYPASDEKVRALLIALSDATVIDAKTKNPERYSVLEVEEPDGKNASSRLIELEDASGKSLAKVIAGKVKPSPTGNRQASGGTYVRRPGDPQSWLASTGIAGGTGLKDWANPRVFETATEKVKTLTVEIPGEAAYDIKRAADGTHELDAVPPGKKIKYVNMIDNIIEAASFLDLENVRKATGATGGDAGTVKFETDDGLKIALKVRREKDGAWATIEAAGEGNAKKAADDIALKAKGWEFEILPSKADTMLKRRDDLLEDAAS